MASVNIIKVLQNVTGKIKEAYLSGINSSGGATDAGKLVITASDGKIDSTFLPNDITAETISATAGEALNAYDLVYLKSPDGKIYKADAGATNKQPCIGFVKASVANAATGTVYFDGAVTGTGFTQGQPVYLSVTAGASTATAPSTAGQIIQQIGIAFSTTQFMFKPQQTLELV